MANYRKLSGDSDYYGFDRKDADEIRHPALTSKATPDPVEHPPHYLQYPIEVIEITERLSFCLGNVVKYVLRCDMKGGIEDLRKAQWYLDREIKRREQG